MPSTSMGANCIRIGHLGRLPPWKILVGLLEWAFLLAGHYWLSQILKDMLHDDRSR